MISPSVGFAFLHSDSFGLPSLASRGRSSDSLLSLFSKSLTIPGEKQNLFHNRFREGGKKPPKIDPH